MNFGHIVIIAFAIFGMASAAPQNNDLPNPVNNTPQQLIPVYQTQQPQQELGVNQQVADNYVPHKVYPYADRYPNSDYVDYPPAGEYMTSLMPSAQTALQIAVKIFAKIGLFLVGGVALLVLGGIFTTAVCSFTPICTITFTGMQNIDKDAMRSFVTPDKISQAADFVQDAIGKYQRLQRAVSN